MQNDAQNHVQNNEQKAVFHVTEEEDEHGAAYEEDALAPATPGASDRGRRSASDRTPGSASDWMCIPQRANQVVSRCPDQHRALRGPHQLGPSDFLSRPNPLAL